MSNQLHRDVRFLKMYSACSTLLFIVLSTAAFRQAPSQRTRFEELDVERINIVESDGRVRLVLSNSQRQAAAVIDGRVLLPDRERPAGLLFFNEEGDEVGGLVFTGRLRDGTAQASGSLTFDQWPGRTPPCRIPCRA